MKNSRIQIKNPEIQAKNPKFWILTCKSYSKKDSQESKLRIRKNPKSKKERRAKSLQSIVRQGFSQESKNSKLFNKNFQILECSNHLPAYLRWLFLRIVTPPPPYTMEGSNPPSIYGEVTRFGFLFGF